MLWCLSDPDGKVEVGKGGVALSSEGARLGLGAGPKRIVGRPVGVWSSTACTAPRCAISKGQIFKSLGRAGRRGLGRGPGWAGPGWIEAEP